MTEGIVHGFEVIDVKKQNGEPLLIRRPVQRLLEQPEKKQTIGQSSQRVVVGKIANALFLRLFAAG